MTVQLDFCQTCSETTLLVFPRGGSFALWSFSTHDKVCQLVYLCICIECFVDALNCIWQSKSRIELNIQALVVYLGEKHISDALTSLCLGIVLT